MSESVVNPEALAKDWKKLPPERNSQLKFSEPSSGWFCSLEWCSPSHRFT